MDVVAISHLQDVANIRDIGGLLTIDGRMTRHGRLLRSGTLADLDAEQVEHVAGRLSFKLRIDLRGTDEIAEIGVSHLDSDECTALLAPIRGGGSLADLEPREALTAHYLAFLDHSGTSFAAIVSALARAESLPAVVHCALGKDRTGVVIAVLLAAIGVRDDDIVADYALTEGRTATVLKRLRLSASYARRLETTPAEMLSARPQVMATFLSGLRNRGGARGYLESVGVSQADLNALSENLIHRADWGVGSI